MHSSNSSNSAEHLPKEAQEGSLLKESDLYIGVTDTHLECTSASSDFKPKLPGPTFQMKVVSDTQQTSISQGHPSSPICMESYKREWYKGYIRTKAYEQSDPFGFSSANVSRDPSRAPSPMPYNTPGKHQTARTLAANHGIYGKVEDVNKKTV